MKALRSLFWVLSLVLPVTAQTLVQNLDATSTVDWRTLTLRCTGNSSLANTQRTQKMEALERARLAAEQRLAKAVEALPYDSERRVAELLPKRAGLAAALAEAVKRFTIVDQRSLSDMSVELDIELPILEQLYPLLLPKRMGHARLRLSDTPLCPTCGQPWPEGKPVPEGVTLIIPSQGYAGGDDQPFTGLVVDARGLGFRPALLPAVLSQAGDQVYGADYVSREVALKNGLMSYHTRVKRALNDERVGRRPMFVRAVAVRGRLKADVVVSDSDALLVHAAAKVHNFLREGRVVVITD